MTLHDIKDKTLKIVRPACDKNRDNICYKFGEGGDVRNTQWTSKSTQNMYTVFLKNILKNRVLLLKVKYAVIVTDSNVESTER